MLMLNLCRGLCGGSAVLALDVGDLQDGHQQLKCILDVVGAVGALQIGNNPSSSSHHHITSQSSSVDVDAA